MDDDIIKQAAMRRQRRARRDPGDSVPTESFSQPTESKIDHGAHNNQLTKRGRVFESHLSANKAYNGRRRPLAMRQDSPRVKMSLVSLPFIDIKIHGVEARALVNSCVMSSIINRHLYQNVFSCDITKGQPGMDRARDVPVIIGLKTMPFDFVIRGDIPDLVIGLDFLSHYKCSVDFGNKTFSCGEDDQVTVKLVNDRDLPLRYRHNNNLAASV